MSMESSRYYDKVNIKGSDYYVSKSNKTNKMYDVFKENDEGKFIFLLSYGHPKYENYSDYFNEYPELIHNDITRRGRYLSRSLNIRDKEGNLTAFNLKSPNYWSIRFLWGFDPLDGKNKKILKKYIK